MSANNNNNYGKKISALSDLIFHKTFASESNKDILAGLAQDIYGIESREITILDPYDIKVYAERNDAGLMENKARHTRKDIKARLETADLAIELQVRKDDFFIERSLKYLGETFVGNYNEALREGAVRAWGGEKDMLFEDEEAVILSRYASLRPVYSLNIVNFIMFHDEYPLRIFGFYDKKRGLSLDREWLSVAYLELKKARMETERQGYWRDYFVGNPLPDSAPGYIRKAAKLLDYANLTQEERRMFDWKEYAESAYESELYTARRIGLDEGREEGRKEGREEGREEERLANAARMKADGVEPALIAKYTGLGIDDISKL